MGFWNHHSKFIVLSYQTAGEVEKHVQGASVVLNHGWLFSVTSQTSTLCPERGILSLQSYQKKQEGRAEWGGEMCVLN